jgi:hypothetical protein
LRVTPQPAIKLKKRSRPALLDNLWLFSNSAQLSYCFLAVNHHHAHSLTQGQFKHARFLNLRE